VVAADEWAENVDDDAFTNAVAKESFRLYNVAAKLLKLPQNPNY
jgi:trehalose/maltose hydrolase-like predicted phosphorylase